MPTRLPTDPHRLTGATLVGVFLLVTLALSAWLGLQALDAARSQRITAEATLRDYAGIAAWELSRAARDNLDEVLGDIFEPAQRRMRDGRLPAPEVVGWDLDEAMREQRCRCADFRSPIALFRFQARPRRTALEPDSMRPTAALDELADSLLRRRPGRRGRSVGLLTRAAGELLDEPVAVGYTVAYDTAGVARGALGFIVRAAALGELLGRWYRERQLLPQPLAGDQPNDSLLSVTVRNARGLTVFASPVSYPGELSARDTIGGAFGDLIVEATVRPDRASQLVIGGLPRSRLPWLAVLMTLTLGVGLAALVQLRREHEFARLRDDFVSGVSHELRTPLTQIRMFAELQEAGKLVSDEDRRRAVSVIHRESRRLSHLVENILRFSRLRRAARPALPAERIELAEALADGIDAVTPLLEARDMRLDLQAGSGIEVRANREDLTRIIVNLLDNATKYGPSGQTVRVSVSRSNGCARLSVADQGPGVPAADRSRVWKPYRRLERDVKGTSPGTGIGLAVVAELAALHGGRAWIEDAQGGGACFIVELPLEPAGTGSAPAPGASA